MQTALVLAQLDGIVEGYAAAAPKEKQLTRTEIVILNALGDLLVKLRCIPGPRR